MYENHTQYYTMEQMHDFIKTSIAANKKVVKERNSGYVYSIPAAFDIETTSIYDTYGEKCGIMYLWGFGINGYVIIGRTWDDFILLYDCIVDMLETVNNKLIVYVHDLGYEFQFMRKRFTWDTTFNIDTRKPVYARTAQNIEFRCSYILSAYSLEKVGEHLHTYPIQKLVGDLDYSKIRHTKTALTDTEIQYLVNDVLVVMAYIQELLDDNHGNITRLPLTNTGFVRKYVRSQTTQNPIRKRANSYRGMIQHLKIADAAEYKQLKRAFQGGFTHANAFFVGDVLKNVGSYDFTSSYPAVMIAEQYPMGNAQKYQPADKNDFMKQLQLYCCMFDVEFTGLCSRENVFDNPLSGSRCYSVENAVRNNGRIVSADRLITTLTEQDFFTICDFYTWDNMKITNFKRYEKDYLPTEFVKAILKLYRDKTELKGVEGKEVEYMNSKGMLNSCYGMAVTDIVKDTITYITDWGCVKADVDETLQEYNKKMSRFLYYPWGVWVTAYARRNLFTGILEFGRDYVYSDTDSIKALHCENHTAYIENYNKRIIAKLKRACEYHKIPVDAIMPKTIKNVVKPLGVWDFEGVYDRFKTLGAKRYMTEQNGKISITVAGLGKSAAGEYFNNLGCDAAFNKFCDDMTVDGDHTGKLSHTYIDDERDGLLTDYLGVTAEYHEKSGIHLEKCSYQLSLTQQFVDFVKGVKTHE